MSETQTPLDRSGYPDVDPVAGARVFADTMAGRRSVRHFSDEPVPREAIEQIIRAATLAPNGANKQPWRFVAVSEPALKRKIRVAVENEERAFYEHRASDRWLDDLAPLGTDASKPYLDVAPWLIAVFKLAKGDDGSQVYYANESVGIAVGLLLAAAHHAGLATLTHTPSPMGFLADVLERPKNERAFLLIPVGYPASDARVPVKALARRDLSEVLDVR
ncbi:MAG: nitroreductase family protein [Planctomycetota bacterium]